MAMQQAALAQDEQKIRMIGACNSGVVAKILDARWGCGPAGRYCSR